MKIASLVARILLGLIFFVFGLNGFLHFIPGQMPTGLAGQFIGAIAQTNYGTVIFALQLIGGVLLLVNRYVPLALALLAPIIFNIVLFHLFMEPTGLVMAIVVALLWVLVAYSVRSVFLPLLQQRVEN